LRGSFADVVVIAVTAPQEVLAERLALRGRGSDGAIEQRLGRSVDHIATPDLTIVNVGNPAYHADQLVRAITGATCEPAPG
jgi:ribose 1,5-bisphosphokinase